MARQLRQQKNKNIHIYGYYFCLLSSIYRMICNYITGINGRNRLNTLQWKLIACKLQVSAMKNTMKSSWFFTNSDIVFFSSVFCGEVCWKTPAHVATVDALISSPGQWRHDCPDFSRYFRVRRPQPAVSVLHRLVHLETHSRHYRITSHWHQSLQSQRYVMYIGHFEVSWYVNKIGHFWNIMICH